MSGKEDNPNQSFSAAAADLKEKIVDAGTYVKDRVTASPTGASGSQPSSGYSKDHADKAKEAKEDAKDHAQTAADRAGDSIKETYNAAGDKVQEKKDDAKDVYNRNVTDKIATNPVEESRAAGEIPANTAAVETVYGKN